AYSLTENAPSPFHAEPAHMELTDYRGAGLHWHSEDVGTVWCSPGSPVVFGVNGLGLVTVYAKDVALLPDWQQRLWAGFNVSPEGGVGEELYEIQAKGDHVETSAPESLFRRGIKLLNTQAQEKLGFRLFREHDEFEAIIARTHRFRSTERGGFFALAKDVARLTADSIDVSGLHKIAPPPADKKQGSLKSLEAVLALKVGADEARRLVGPLFGVLELRHADAHLPSKELGDAFGLVGVNPDHTFVIQGKRLLQACSTALFEIREALEGWSSQGS
ncbi:MAG: hypothetical protein WD733_15385, partial [Bryobacterales bacterium]